MRFEWDDSKALENLTKHGVSFGESTEVFYDPNALEDYQADRAAGIDEEATMKPGRYVFKRGGFLARHPELRIKEKKRA